MHMDRDELMDRLDDELHVSQLLSVIQEGMPVSAVLAFVHIAHWMVVEKKCSIHQSR